MLIPCPNNLVATHCLNILVLMFVVPVAVAVVVAFAVASRLLWLFFVGCCCLFCLFLVLFLLFAWLCCLFLLLQSLRFFIQVSLSITRRPFCIHPRGVRSTVTSSRRYLLSYRVVFPLGEWSPIHSLQGFIIMSLNVDIVLETFRVSTFFGLWEYQYHWFNTIHSGVICVLVFSVCTFPVCHLKSTSVTFISLSMTLTLLSGLDCLCWNSTKWFLLYCKIQIDSIISRWWFQPIRTICSSNWKFSPTNEPPETFETPQPLKQKRIQVLFRLVFFVLCLWNIWIHIVHWAITKRKLPLHVILNTA